MEKLEPGVALHKDDRDILERLKAVEPIRLNEPQYYKIAEVENRTLALFLFQNYNHKKPSCPFVALNAFVVQSLQRRQHGTC